MLDYNRQLMLQGYIDLLEKAPIHGGCVHKTSQYITVIRLKLEINHDISEMYENRIKQLIRVLYGDYEKGNNESNITSISY